MEVTVGRGPDKPALPMLPGETVLAEDVAEGILNEDRTEVAPGFQGIFELTDDENYAPETS